MSQAFQMKPILAESSVGILSDALMTGLILLVVVFSVLVVLSLVIRLFGLANRPKKEKPTAKAEPAPAPAAPSAPAAPAVVVDSDDDEIAAVIAAAVAMMAPAGVTYQVKRITPAGGRQRPEWASAAIRQNTAPF